MITKGRTEGKHKDKTGTRITQNSIRSNRANNTKTQKDTIMQRKGHTQIKIMKQKLQTKFFRCLTTDQTVCIPHLKRTEDVNQSTKKKKYKSEKKLRKSTTHLVERTPDVVRASISDILANRTPHRHEGHQYRDILHPGLLQSPTQAQHQEIHHRGHLEHPEDLLMRHTVTMQKHFKQKFPSKNETTPIHLSARRSQHATRMSYKRHTRESYPTQTRGTSIQGHPPSRAPAKPHSGATSGNSSSWSPGASRRSPDAPHGNNAKTLQTKIPEQK